MDELKDSGIIPVNMGIDCNDINNLLIEIQNTTVNIDALNKIDKEIAVKYLLLPFDIKDNTLYVVAQYTSKDVLDEIEKGTGMKIKRFITSWHYLLRAIDYFYNVKLGKP
jgi:hypothetical protein